MTTSALTDDQILAIAAWAGHWETYVNDVTINRAPSPPSISTKLGAEGKQEALALTFKAIGQGMQELIDLRTT